MGHLAAPQQENNPEILRNKLTYKRKLVIDIIQNILPDKELEIGKSYSVNELIYRMIAFSDNEAYNLLRINMHIEWVRNMFKDIGIFVPDVRDNKDLISAREYGFFFRILFNASYLNHAMSEKALKILTKTTFKTGIVAGVPPYVNVAHKFAEKKDATNQMIQLHDCGIIYYKNAPYVLCIMTYGNDFADLLDIIKNISSIVYNEVDDYYKNKDINK